MPDERGGAPDRVAAGCNSAWKEPAPNYRSTTRETWGVSMLGRWWDPREWIFGLRDMHDQEGMRLGLWWCIGPFAITFGSE